MSLRSWFGFGPKTPPAQVYWHQDIDVQTLLDGLLGQPVGRLWREQPHLRTVVGFIARNIAHLGLHVYRREDDDGRTRLRDGPLPTLLDRPNGQRTTYELIYETVASLCLFDIAFWYVAVDNSAPSGWVIRHIPSSWIIGTIGKSAFTVDAYKVALPSSNGQWAEIPAGQMMVFHGWNPDDPTQGSSPVHALKSILAEQVSAQIYRNQVWLRGGRVGSYIYRPPEAPPWDDVARSSWVQSYRDTYAGDNAPRAGGEPLMEDGMELRRVGFSAKDDMFIEAAKLSLETCAQVYHLNPTMIGVLDNANYSNVREFRQMLYGDSLGPYLAQFEQRINGLLVPRMASPGTYVEFNLAAKLAGNFEEQSKVMQSAIGAPWMTINEGRAKQNLPAVAGGDELVRPLNITAPGSQTPIPAEPEPDPSTEEKHNGHILVNEYWRAVQDGADQREVSRR